MSQHGVDDPGDEAAVHKIQYSDNVQYSTHLQYTRYATKLHLSAREPLTRVEAVAAKVNWKKNLESRKGGTERPMK